MSFERILSPGDAARADGVLQKLARHGFEEFALTGGLAIELQLLGRERVQRVRCLNDMDLVVHGFAAIPESVVDGFLLRHVHPNAPEGKTLVQLIDPEAALRVDVFLAYGGTMARSQPLQCGNHLLSIVALEDIAAREASLLMDLERSVEVAAKHAEDFQRLAEAVDLERAEVAWRDHRKQSDPPTFEEARKRVTELMRLRTDLLVAPVYSHDPEVVCAKCEETGRFRLAPAKTILAILGYC